MKVEIPWWLPPAYDEAKKQGYEGTMSDFVTLIIVKIFGEKKDE